MNMHLLKISSFVLLGLILNGCNRGSDYGPVIEETYVHRYGVPVPADDWTSRGQSGKIVTTLKNGVVVSKSLTAGVLEGETTYSFPHSELIQKVETYSQGNIQKFIVYYYSGKPALEVIYNTPDNRSITKWYENGVPQSKEQIINEQLINGEYFTSKNQLETKVANGHGIRMQRDQYGQLISTDTIENGEMVLCATCYPNGSPKEWTPYKNQVIEGQLKTFLPAGDPDTNATYVAGKKEGITIVYQNGEKYAEVPYVSDIRQGIEKRYRDGDSLVEEVTWNNDQRHGPTYIHIGNTKKTEWYYQNRLVTEKTFDLLNRGKPY